MNKPYVSVVIAALNEEEAIGKVINDVPRQIADEIIVVDNGSSDRTAEIAAAAGARVVTEPQRGYGRAFRAGLRSLSADCKIVVFLDGDGSDYRTPDSDMSVTGSQRLAGRLDKGAVFTIDAGGNPQTEITECGCALRPFTPVARTTRKASQ